MNTVLKAAPAAHDARDPDRAPTVADAAAAYVAAARIGSRRALLRPFLFAACGLSLAAVCTIILSAIAFGGSPTLPSPALVEVAAPAPAGARLAPDFPPITAHEVRGYQLPTLALDD